MRPAAVLLDLSLSEADGIETLDALAGRETTRDVPVIIVGVPAEASHPLPAPVHDWIAKPFVPEQMVGAVAAALSTGVSLRAPSARRG